MADPARSQAIAIIGMAGRFPGAVDLDGFWQNIKNGVESLEVFTDAELDAARVDAELRAHPRYVRKGTVLEGADLFDAAFFGMAPREAQILDPQQRIFLECTWEALENAGYAGATAEQAVGVYAGVGMNTYIVSQLLQNPAFLASAGGYQLMVGNDKDFLATRASYKLDLRGPSITVQTACSTSLVAVTLACRALARGECDLALAGGVAVLFPQRAGYLFEEGMILSPDGHCRPFDERARGTRGSSGAGVVVLKRLSKAEQDGDTIHSVILGTAINNDGAGKAGYTAPSVEGQVEVIATAQAVASVPPRTISYVEAHGTGTALGDPIEIAALTQAFRASTLDVGFCRIGSLKANIGHLDAAAGVASLIKATLVLENREFPPLVNFRSPNPELALDTSPFIAESVSSPWAASSAAPRRAAVSSFGIGGTNAHAVLEEAPAVARTAAIAGPHLLLLSAKTPTALDAATTALAAHLARHPETRLSDVAFTLAAGRQAFQHRRSVAVRDAAHAIAVLAEPQRAPVLSESVEGARNVAFLFSGQGSQHVGMGKELYGRERVYRDAFSRAASLLEPHLGLDVRAVIFTDAADERINETRFAQPALFATEYALASLWMSWGVAPTAMLGHSIGEYVAAHLAGVLSLEDALAVVAARGRLMQALPAGSMAAVSLSAAELEPRLEPGVELAAVNAPSLCTVSGPTDAVSRLVERLGSSGVDCRPLHTSHAFHSSMMEPALAPFLDVFRGVKLSPPSIPYLSNLTGKWITPAEATSPQYYAHHLRRAVRFEAGVRALAADPALLLLEVGPGNTLTSLARQSLGRDAAKRAFASLPHPRETRSDVEVALESAGRLWLSGARLDFAAMHAASRPRRVPLPTYPFERKRFWVDAVPVAPTRGVGPRVSAYVDDWAHAPTWTRDDSVSVGPVTLENVWLVLAEGDALGQAVGRQVRAAGAAAVFIEPGEAFERIESTRFRVRPSVADDLARVVREVRAAIGPIDGAIQLWGARLGTSLDDRERAAALLYHPLVALAATLEPSFGGRTVRLVAATFGAESVLDEPVRSPAGALVLGPVIALPLEMPGLHTRAVDLVLPESATAVQDVARELVIDAAHSDGEQLAAWRGGRRWVRRFEPILLPAAGSKPLPIKTNGVYLVTGGLGEIALVLSRWLATTYSARLLLTTRTAPPPRDTWAAWLAEHPSGDRYSRIIAAIQEMERAGAEVEIAVAAAEDEAAMSAAVAGARARWGALNGVIHAAGVTGTGSIALLKTEADVAATLAPKLGGLSVLTRVLGDASLDFVALFSSINSLLGTAGASDYGSANAVLDAFGESALVPAGWERLVTIDWGPWREIGMAARLVVPEAARKERELFLRHSMSPAGGVEAFARVLASGRRRVVVTPFDPTDSIRMLREQALAAREVHAASDNGKSNGSAVARPELASAYEAPETEAQGKIAQIWAELLGIERVGVHDDFFELGGHSLLATRVLARIDQVLGVRLTLRDVFDAPTIHRLSERLALKAGGGPAPAAAEGEREEIEF